MAESGASGASRTLPSGYQMHLVLCERATRDYNLTTSLRAALQVGTCSLVRGSCFREPMAHAESQGVPGATSKWAEETVQHHQQHRGGALWSRSAELSLMMKTACCILCSCIGLPDGGKSSQERLPATSFRALEN
jgi:hypothetical protein